ncbi:hypothetical protein ODS41_07390 [Pyrobaculum sp. 3827-6]|uniref:hypothetical protein n=1 Tax=Pyrobaculum sp. 3827-6 TaxID=2983604 RepID=UPI0021DAB307|nr:hypothetical protein [Pyrobaculum sp. 3827-6]MCU7787736.1 hypothetical protein [Pyrobaculum sp. 3827-6]
MVEVLVWWVVFTVALWVLLSLLAGRAVNPLGVFLGVVLAPVAFLVAAVVVGFLAVALGVFIWPLLVLAPFAALLAGFLAALFVVSALAGVDMVRAFIALLLATVLLLVLSGLLWHSPLPPRLPLHF